MRKLALPGGVWSATPTPFLADGRIDVPSIHRLVAHHVTHGVNGLLLGGSCGEGAWMRLADLETLTRTAVEAAAGRLCLTLQVTDNSPGRTLDNIELAQAWGAQIAVISEPYFFLNFTSERLLAHFQEIIRRSPLPVGLYNRGAVLLGTYVMADSHLLELLAEPNLVIVKDSMGTPARRDLFATARRQRPDFTLLSGNEFDCISYLEAGYDGLLLGGGIFNASLAHRIIAAVRRRDLTEAVRLQARMNDLMFRVYGGEKIACWLTGEKELLVQLGVFSTRTSLLGYPLTEACRAAIAAAVDGSDGMGFRADLLQPAFH